MLGRGRETLVAVGSAIVIVLFVLVIAEDGSTVFALLIGAVLALAAVHALSPDRVPFGDRLARHRNLLLVLVGGLSVIALSEDLDDLVILSFGLVGGYTGYRSRRVFKGGLYGGIVGAVIGLGLVMLVIVGILGAGLLDIANARALLYKAAFAPPLVGFLTGVAALYLLVLGAVIGAITGCVGGALFRLGRLSQ